jgi:hypothetical protein
VLVIVPLMWRLRGVDAPAVTEQGARSQPEPSSVAPAPMIPSAGGGSEQSGKAPPGTYVVACFRGGALGAVLGAAVAAIGVIVSIGTEDKWFEMFVLVYVQVGAGIGLVLGGIVEPLRVRLRRARAAER